jgi:N-methylhydantoinase A
VPLPPAALSADDAKTLRAAFEQEYATLFRRAIPGAAIEALSWSVLVSTPAKPPRPGPPTAAHATATSAETRAVFDGRAGASVDVPVYRRDRLTPGAHLPGPAMIAEDATSTFVSASFDAYIDAAGCIVMERKTG